MRQESASPSGHAAAHPESDFRAALSFTRFTAIKPARLSKRFTLTGPATLKKEGGGDLLEGTAEKLIVADLAEFAALLPTLTPRQALSYGTNGHDRARVVTAAAVAATAAQSSEPVIARTRDHFTWPTGAGVLMLDYDAPQDGPALSPAELRATLAAACPALADAPAVWRPSASSCIFTQAGAELRGIAGQRLYVAVSDAADIPRALAVLFDRLWLAGFGRYELSKSGAWLARAAIDASVAQPERLDFCGGADCGKGLQQRLPDPILINEAAPYLDTRAALPDLDAGERQRLAELRESLKEPLREEQQRIREEWVMTRVDARLSALPEAARVEAGPKLEKVYRKAADGGQLEPDFELVVVKKGTQARKRLTVGELLKDRAQYHGATTLDPLEPDYPNGQSRLVGWLNLEVNAPFLRSHAHGGTRYTLVGPPRPARPEPASEEPWKAQLVTNDEGEIAKIHHNAVLIAENAYPGLVGFNEFTQRIEARTAAPWRKAPGPWTDYDTQELAFHLVTEFLPAFRLDMLDTAVQTAARRHPFNPAQERLRALADQWDGVPRLDSWLTRYLNAETTAENRAYLAELGPAFLKGVAARVLFPGCKRDDVLALVGAQGYVKSGAAQAIADCIMPNTFTDSLGNLGSDEAAIGVQGIIIAEFSELAALGRSELEAVKAFISRPSDRYRPKYARNQIDQPRTCSFIATTNEDAGFLRDPSGNRRWWPITITEKIDLPALKLALPLLMGEAAKRALAGEPWHVSDAEALRQAESVRADCADSDVWEPAVLNSAARLNDRERTIGNILADMGVSTERQDRRAQTRVSNILRANGYQRKRGRDTTGGRGYLWLKLSPMSTEGGQKGDTGLASEIAAVPSVPICPPQEKKYNSEPRPTEESAAANVKNDEGVKIKVIGNEGDDGGQGTRWGTNTRPTAPAPRADDGLKSQHRPVDSPLTRRILAALDGCPGGVARDDLIRIVGNEKGASPAMLDAEINALLLRRRIATVNGRLVGETQP